MTESAAYLEFVHLPTYVRSSKGLLDDEGQRAIEENLCNHPEAGDLIEDTGGVRKLRVALPGRGKRGGARLIYYFPKAKARIYLILLYPKGSEGEPQRGGKEGDAEAHKTAGGRTMSVKKAARRKSQKRLGAEIIEGLREAVAYERGDLKGVEVRRVAFTARDAVVEPAPAFDSHRIVELREELELSQSLFARALNISPETVRAWEQGKRNPDGASLRLLQLAEEHPQWILRTVRPVSSIREPSRPLSSGRDSRRTGQAGTRRGNRTSGSAGKMTRR